MSERHTIERDYWQSLYEAEHQLRLEAEDAYRTLEDLRRSERPEQFTQRDCEVEPCH